jgi:predicted RNase H-like HicB family nuclease
MTILYWKSILERPEIMTQGKTIEELAENIADAYRMMTDPQ